MATKPILTDADLEEVFKGNNRFRNTKYLCSVLNNPDSPTDNVVAITDYYQKHPEKFLNNEEFENSRGYLFKRRKTRPSAIPGRIYMPDGFSYNQFTGECFDPSGNPVGGWKDGGERRFYRDSYKLYSWGRKSSKNDPSEPMSARKVNQLMFGLKSNYARTRYFLKVRDNPDSNPDTIDQLAKWVELHPQYVISESEAQKMAEDRKARKAFSRGYGRPYGNGGYSNGGQYGYGRGYGRPYGSPYAQGYGRNFYGGFRKTGYGEQRRGWFRSFRDYDQESFSSAWMAKDEFDSLPPREKSLFSRFLKTKDRNKNSKLALKISVDDNSSPEEKAAVKRIVNRHPKLFFRKGGSQ